MDIENHGAYMTVLYGNCKFFIFIAHALPIDYFDSLMEIMLPLSAGIELTDITRLRIERANASIDLPTCAIASW
jgi:hypothetical protein